MLLEGLSIFLKLIFLHRFPICMKPKMKFSSSFITVKWISYFFLTRSLSLLFLNKPLDFVLFLFLFFSKICSNAIICQHFLDHCYWTNTCFILIFSSISLIPIATIYFIDNKYHIVFLLHYIY